MKNFNNKHLFDVYEHFARICWKFRNDKEFVERKLQCCSV